MTIDKTEIAVLVSIKLTGWQGRRKVASVGEELTDTKGAAKDAADVFVNLVSKEFLAPINAVDREIRAEFYALTFDTGITGVRALPYSVQPTLTAALAGLFDRRDSAIEEMLGRYSAERQRRAVSMGRLFNSDHYPEPGAVAASFGANLSFVPMPAAWKLGIDDDKVKLEIEDTRRDIIKASDGDAWNRVYSTATDTLTRLERFIPASTDEKARHHFNQSLITSINKLFETMGEMYFGNDHDRMNNCLNELKTYVGDRDLTVLKSDDAERRAAIEATRRVIAAIEARPDFKAPPVPAPAKVEAEEATGFTFTVTRTGAPPVEEAPADTIGLYDDLLD